jgi:hypothetical protein
MNDRQRVVPHILRKDIDTTREQIAIARVDGVDALVVAISEESARGVISATSFEGMEPQAVTVEEIERICADYGIGTVGLFDLDDGAGLDVISVEVVGLLLREGG